VPADRRQQRGGVSRQIVAAPGDHAVGPDQDQPALVQPGDSGSSLVDGLTSRSSTKPLSEVQ
jgi:hypothetical protein